MGLVQALEREVFKMAIGRKRKTHKTSVAIKIKRAKTGALGVKKPQRKIEINPAKRLQQFLKNYDDAIAKGELKKIKEIEQLKALYPRNKDGSFNKSKLRSNDARRAFNKTVKEFNKKYTRWGKRAVKEMGEEQRRKERQKKEKGAETYSERGQKEVAKKAEEMGFDFKGTAYTAFSEYYRMVDLFADDMLTKLREELNLGSTVVAIIAKQDLDIDVLKDYLSDFYNAIQTLPKEARNLASQDDLSQALFKMTQLIGTDNLSDTLSLFLETDNKEERNRIIRMSLYYDKHKEETNKDFYTYYKDFEKEDFTDKDNEKTWGEML